MASDFDRLQPHPGMQHLRSSNNVGEILAIKEAIEMNPKDIPLRIISNSKTTIEGLTRNLRNWEDEGFKTIQNGQLIQVTVARIRERTAPTSFEWVKGHSGIEGNEGADKLAAEGCQKPEGSDLIDMHIPADYLLPGAKLANITQSTAYKIIRQNKIKLPGSFGPLHNL